jgi:Ca2+-binding RTX toxin-like protein
MGNNLVLDSAMRTAGTFGWGLVFAAWPALAQPAVQFTAIRAVASNQIELVWSSDTNRLFAIERTADLGDWDNAMCVAISEPSAQFASNRWTGAMDTTTGFFRLLASPPLGASIGSHTNLGTPTNDTQIVVGTTNWDYVMQFGNGGEDTQYVSASAGEDWIQQAGGAGEDTQTVRAGTGNDYILQNGNAGTDIQNIYGDDGDDLILQQGGDGNDSLNVAGGRGSDRIYQYGNAGNDNMRTDGGDGDDLLTISGDAGDDSIRYDASQGLDEVTIDGGPGCDTLIANEQGVFLTIRLPDGTGLYTSGPGNVVTVVDVEFIYVEDAEGNTIWSWTAP